MKINEWPRHGIQALWAALTNSHISGFVTGKIYTGKLKNVCVPGLKMCIRDRHLAEPGWHCHHDHFKDSNPNIEWKATLDQAEKIGLGIREYELKIIK